MLIGIAPVNLFLSNRLMKVQRKQHIAENIAGKEEKMLRCLQNLEAGDATNFSRDRTRQLIVVK